MLLSIALIFMVGLSAGWICQKLHLPALFGMILTGICLGPYALNLIDGSILNISAELRKIALIIILTRAGLSLNIADLKKVGRPAVLMCFLPACMEMIGMVLLAPKLMGISLLDAAILGAVIGAVSPAVIVPKMLKLMDEGYGTEQSIPQMVLAGASVDDVFVIVMFTSFTGLAAGGSISVMRIVSIPVSIVGGIAVGLLAGFLLTVFLQKNQVRDMIQVILFLSVAFVLSTMEDRLPLVPFASLIAIMCMGIAMQRKNLPMAKSLSVKFNKMWMGAEILLFVLVGATVDLHYVAIAGINAVILIFGVLVFRVIGVWLCVLGTSLNTKERIFCMFAYMPKATVQAAIGGVPLAMGLSCGSIVLTVAVMAILITAPLGAFLIENTYRTFLKKAR